ncbi:hypothetical protein Tco_0727883 [Tanacetum coccineum]|uniref:Uncharacterized protein n=1 Tax=Tanacetum coccineum TaxID=301880 RepID=A0ABQ4YKE2_9ASTR
MGFNQWRSKVFDDSSSASMNGGSDVFSTWIAFGGNTRDLGSFGKETDEITDLHQILEEVLLIERGDGVTIIKRQRRDLFSDGVWNLETALGQNANPPPTSNRPVLPAALRAQAVQELHKLQRILAFVDSRLESIENYLSNFANHPNEANMNDLESDDESVDTPLVSSFPHSDNDSDNDEVLNELIEYENVGMLCREKAINSFDGDDLEF